MAVNNLKIASRSFKKQPLHSFITLFGLTVGLACTMVIGLFIRKETSFDRYHSKADTIYRIAHDRTLNGSIRHLATTPIYLASIIQNQFPEVTSSVRIIREPSATFEYENNIFTEPEFTFADSTFLEIFDIPILRGKENALSDPTSVLISATTAEKYFGNADPIGKSITYTNWGNSTELQVAAVFEDFPDNSHVQFEVFIPYHSPANIWQGMHGTDWFYSGAWTYVQLGSAAEAQRFEQQLSEYVAANLPAPLDKSTRFYLQPLKDIYLHSQLDGEAEANGNITNVYVFTVIALLILVVSSINFINLSTARALNRSKEVGVRKTLGAHRSTLMRQFLSESVLISSLASVLAILLVALTLPLFNELANQQLRYSPLTEPGLTLLVVGIGVITGLFSGLYPALFMSAFNPTKALKSAVYGSTDKGVNIRKVLVAFQMSISIILLIAAATVKQQLSFFRNQELGFTSDQVAVVSGFNFRSFENLKTELASISGVEKVAGGTIIPGAPSIGAYVSMCRTDLMDADDRIETLTSFIDFDYIDFFGLELAQGRGFSSSFQADPAESIIVNERFLRQAGIEGDAIGQKVHSYNMVGAFGNTKTIVGVLKDFHTESLHGQIRPQVFHVRGNFIFNTAIQISAGSSMETIASIREKAQPFSTAGAPITLRFLDAELNKLYEKEYHLQKVITAFTFLAILISALGLFGLASHTAAQKRKEIGIRKVLGASMSNLLVVLSRQISMIVLVAFIISSPLAYLLADGWLDNFAYHIELGPQIFITTGIVALGVTWLTIGYQSVKSALKNPIHSLRDE